MSHFGRMNVVLSRTGRCHNTVGGYPPLSGGDPSLPPVPDWKGVVGVNVVTYEELFQLLMVLITFASLIITIIKKK